TRHRERAFRPRASTTQVQNRVSAERCDEAQPAAARDVSSSQNLSGPGIQPLHGQCVASRRKVHLDTSSDPWRSYLEQPRNKASVDSVIDSRDVDEIASTRGGEAIATRRRLWKRLHCREIHPISVEAYVPHAYPEIGIWLHRDNLAIPRIHVDNV